MTDVLMVVFNGVIAIATTAYVIFTRRLWKETKESADAARTSAEAAKRSAEIDAALHRPYLGVSQFLRHNDFNADRWAVRWVVKNYGTLPACDVKVEIAIDRDGRGDFARGPVCQSWELFPQAALEGTFGVPLDQVTRAALVKHEPAIAGHVSVKYTSPEGKCFRHTADFAYDPAAQNFRPDRSQTKGSEQA